MWIVLLKVIRYFISFLAVLEIFLSIKNIGLNQKVIKHPACGFIFSIFFQLYKLKRELQK